MSLWSGAVSSGHGCGKRHDGLTVGGVESPSIGDSNVFQPRSRVSSGIHISHHCTIGESLSCKDPYISHAYHQELVSDSDALGGDTTDTSQAPIPSSCRFHQLQGRRLDLSRSCRPIPSRTAQLPKDVHGTVAGRRRNGRCGANISSI